MLTDRSLDQAVRAFRQQCDQSQLDDTGGPAVEVQDARPDEREDRPVEQVDAVAAPADCGERRPTEDTGPRAGGGGSGDHRAPENRCRDEPASVQPAGRLLGRHHQDHESDQAEGCCDRQHPHSTRAIEPRRQPAHHPRHQCTDEQLPRPGVGAVVDEVVIVCGERRPERSERQGEEPDGQRPSPSQRRQERDDAGEHEVELLLDRQRPEVQHGAGSAGEEFGVGLAGGQEPPVGDVRRTGHDVAAQRLHLHGGDQPWRGGEHEHQTEQRRRGEAADAAPPERS